MVFLREFFEKVDFEKKNQQTTKKSMKITQEAEFKEAFMQSLMSCLISIIIDILYMMGNFSCFCCHLLTFQN